MIKMKPKRQGVKLGVERRSDKESKTVLHWNDKESSSMKGKGNKDGRNSPKDWRLW